MKFKSNRDQFVDGNPVKKGETVDVEADRVAYLVARGYLEPVEAKKAAANKPADKAAS